MVRSLVTLVQMPVPLTKAAVTKATTALPEFECLQKVRFIAAHNRAAMLQWR